MEYNKEILKTLDDAENKLDSFIPSPSIPEENLYKINLKRAILALRALETKSYAEKKRGRVSKRMNYFLRKFLNIGEQNPNYDYSKLTRSYTLIQFINRYIVQKYKGMCFHMMGSMLINTNLTYVPTADIRKSPDSKFALRSKQMKRTYTERLMKYFSRSHTRKLTPTYNKEYEPVIHMFAQKIMNCIKN